MWLLALQIAAVLSAPLFDRIAARTEHFSHRLQRIVRLVVVAVVLSHVVPEGWAEAGIPAIVAAFIGFLLAFGAERATGEHQSMAAMAIAMALHHLFDGFALGQPAHGRELAPGIVLHTLPVALLAWRLAGWKMLGLLIVSSALGFGLARAGAAPTGDLAAVFACFVAGWLTQGIGHGHGEGERSADPSQARPAEYRSRADLSASTKTP